MAIPVASFESRPVKSFKDVLRGLESTETSKIKFECGNHLGSPAIFISDEDMVTLAKPFALTLIGKFATSRPPLAVICKFLNRMKFSRLVNVDLHDNFNVVFRFAVDSDCNRFFLHRYYTVFGVNMKVIKWPPFSDFSKELPIVPVWINFQGLRLQLFDKPALLVLGKTFGNPLNLDSSTAGFGNMSKARILVEVDVSLPIPKKVWIGSKKSGYFQSVIVENKPLYCGKCRIFGHEEKLCSANSQKSIMVIFEEMDGSVNRSKPPSVNIEFSINDEGINSPIVPGTSGEGGSLEEGEIHMQKKLSEFIGRGNGIVNCNSNPVYHFSETISMESSPAVELNMIPFIPKNNYGNCFITEGSNKCENESLNNCQQESKCSKDSKDKCHLHSLCGEMAGIEKPNESEVPSLFVSLLDNTGEFLASPPQIENVKEVSSKVDKLQKCEYPLSGMTTRAKNKLGGVRATVCGGEESGSKHKRKKEETWNRVLWQLF